MLPRNEFQFRIATARQGEAISYFIGDLMFERFTRGKDSQVAVLAAAVWDAHVEGKCTLVQRRLGPNKYEYIAVKLPEPHRRVAYTGCYDREFLLGAMPSKPSESSHRVTRVRPSVASADWLPAAPAGM